MINKTPTPNVHLVAVKAASVYLLTCRQAFDAAGKAAAKVYGTAAHPEAMEELSIARYSYKLARTHYVQALNVAANSTR